MTPVAGIDESDHSFYALQHFFPASQPQQYRLIVVTAKPFAASAVGLAGPGIFFSWQYTLLLDFPQSMQLYISAIRCNTGYRLIQLTCCRSDMLPHDKLPHQWFQMQFKKMGRWSQGLIDSLVGSQELMVRGTP
ncbi:hypothetical protein U9M48_003935 [Paspalum notatum var. saurae]|uniref:Uncharacterized protein n=1 Tax=Paspalum notatum var. saurae TaxID=547442 RepID=A0AAQ3SHA2_PASNO